MLYINNVLISKEYQAIFERDIDDITLRINIFGEDFNVPNEFHMLDFVELKFECYNKEFIYKKAYITKINESSISLIADLKDREII